LRLAVAGVLLAACLVTGGASADAGRVDLIGVSGTINPASSDYIQRAVRQSAAEGADALIIELDTPGGLVSSTKDIIQAILNAEVPVIVYVAPRGAWAGSAGTFITLAGHVAAMAPGTTIGAAHPVGIGGGSPGEGEKEGSRDYAGEKAENMLVAFIESIAKQRKRNVEWAAKAVRESVAISADEALKLHVIDLVAPSRRDLLEQADGRKVDVAGAERVLHVADAEIHEIPMTMLQRFLHELANPDVAVLLILAGLLGLYVEFSNPGMVLPGVAGAVCLILGAIALQILPFSWLGLLLLAGGVVLMVAEIMVGSYGVLFGIGILCIFLGGTLVFDLPEMSDVRVSVWSVLAPAVAALALFGGIIVFGVGRSLGRRQTAGVGEMLGMRGRAESALNPEGRVYVRGEYWTARSDEPVAAGERVEVVGVEGLRLRVRRAAPES
jgi:membrane-bound serine protease (ClpP class)